MPGVISMALITWGFSFGPHECEHDNGPMADITIVPISIKGNSPAVFPVDAMNALHIYLTAMRPGCPLLNKKMLYQQGLAAIVLCAILGFMGVHVHAQMPPLVSIPAGPFISGSDRAEREAAYRLDERAYGHSVTRKGAWYESERDRGVAETDAFRITRTPITNAEYAKFTAATGHPFPTVSKSVWQGYGLIHPFERTQKFAWVGGKPPVGREDHPVVLVSRDDAKAYATWLSQQTGVNFRLPTDLEWEKAARGPSGTRFPWGDEFDADRLNSHDRGPFDTTPVGSFPTGASPFGVLDVAGQVFEWTANGERRAYVKGGSWDDSGCGVCRPAARHARPVDIKHILIGFRLIQQ